METVLPGIFGIINSRIFHSIQFIDDHGWIWKLLNNLLYMETKFGASLFIPRFKALVGSLSPRKVIRSNMISRSLLLSAYECCRWEGWQMTTMVVLPWPNLEHLSAISESFLSFMPSAATLSSRYLQYLESMDIVRGTADVVLLLTARHLCHTSSSTIRTLWTGG